jgi:hypothetical protein
MRKELTQQELDSIHVCCDVWITYGRVSRTGPYGDTQRPEIVRCLAVFFKKDMTCRVPSSFNRGFMFGNEWSLMPSGWPIDRVPYDELLSIKIAEDLDGRDVVENPINGHSHSIMTRGAAERLLNKQSKEQ